MKYLAAGLAFIITLAACLNFAEPPLSDRKSEDDREAHAPLGSQKNRSSASISAPSLVDQVMALTGSNRDSKLESKLAIGKRAERSSPPTLHQALAALLQLPEDERAEALSLLLLGWASSDPAAAMLWCHENLEGAEMRHQQKDLARSWAHHDAIGLGTWWAQNMSENELGGTSQLVGIIPILVRADPFAYASYMDHPQLSKTRFRGVIREQMLPEIEEIPALAAKLIGQTEYGSAGLNPDTDSGSANTSPPTSLKTISAWNELFETVATAWNREAPEDVETWLQQFPQNAQAAARAAIAKQK